MRSLFNCIHCLMKFKRKEDLAKHILKEHKIKDNSGAIMNDTQHDGSEEIREALSKYLKKIGWLLDSQIKEGEKKYLSPVSFGYKSATAKAQAEIEELKDKLITQNNLLRAVNNCYDEQDSRIKELEQTAVNDATMYRETLDKIKRHKCNFRNKEKS